MQEWKKTTLSDNELIDVIGGSAKSYIRRLGPDGGYGGRESKLISMADMIRRRI